MHLNEGQRLGEYVIRGAIGAGGMGEVYRATDTGLERDVAIKVLPREVADDFDRRARFEREAKSIAALNHENIVTIHSIGEDGGVRYLAMELVEGETLGDRIPDSGLATDDLLAIAIPVASALAAAQAKGIVHRDLKPANVMVTDEGKVKVLDFGLAKLAHRADEPLKPVGEDSATAALWYVDRVKKERRARNVTLPEIQRLLDEGDRGAALRLMREAARVIPGDAQLEQLEKGNTLPVLIETVPPGAEVFINSYADLGRSWLSLGVTPIEPRLPLEELRFRIEKAGYETFLGTSVHTTARTVVELIPVGESPKGMVRIPTGSASFGTAGRVEIESFWLDRYEVTNQRFKEFVDAGGYRNPEYWTEPVIKDGRLLEREEASALFVDTTGRPGPAEWELGSFPDAAADHPVGGISWYEASAFTAWSGTSLPTVYHWRRAAELGLFADIITVSNFDGRGPAPVGSYGGIGPHGTYDMAGNVREWCINRGGDSRYSLGGSWSDPAYMYDGMEATDPLDRSAMNGLRTMRETGVVAAEAMVSIDNPVFDFRAIEPVGDDVFEVVKGAFAYDRTELDARFESVDDSSTHWRRERVSFAAAYGDERVPAYLFLPKNAEPPYQTVVFFPSSAALDLDNSRNPGMFMVTFLIRSGRALMYPIYTGTYERQITIDGYNDQRDVIIRASKDLQRSIDYLETRDDISSDRLAFCGLSLGASWGPIFTAVEDRFDASILIAGGLHRPEPGRPPETLAFNFAPRSTVPVLMVNGRNDFWTPLETEIRPMVELQGAPADDKELVLLDGGHIPNSPKDAVRPILDWLDHYLGPVQ